ncbi:MAG TPA: acyloxyacyl hydrolase [Alphaproteobacteria bacterium]|nr:acyloxyacyl hydrolase [Alphaproteobacteria bacterium]
MPLSPFARTLALALALSAGAGAAAAQSAEGTVLTGSVGWFDFNDNEDAAMAGVEARFSPLFWKVSPIVGLFGTSDGGAYGYGGLALPLNVTENIAIIPAFAVGAYHEGSGKDLGHTLEFRSALELSYHIGGGHRLGLTVAHLSNASLDDNNPGTETLTLNYTVPLGW